jgi:transcriptional antiterminator Rof (Rho-off)
MSHLMEPCDFLDVLEEAAVLKSAVSVELRHGKHFEDHVRDVVTEEGQNFAIFANHGRVSVRDISSARRARIVESTYAGKLGQ